VTYPPEYDPASQPGGSAQPGPMGNQPYPPPGQPYPPQPGQPYPQPGQPYGQPNQPYGLPNQPYGQPDQAYWGAPGSPPGLSYQSGQPVGVPPFQPPAASNMANVARSRGIRQIVIGGVLFLIGLIITVATYSSASSSRTGGTYFVAYGPMIFGIIGIIRGAIAVAQAQKLR
jgi:hypothetical protein